MGKHESKDPTVGVSVTLQMSMGVIPNENEGLENAVRRELDQNLTGIRAANLLDSAGIKNVEQIKRSESNLPANTTGEGAK